MKQVYIVGLGGSSNPHSSSTAALETALTGVRDAGAEVTRFDVKSLALPMYEYGMTNPAAEQFAAAVRKAHGMIWCSPLYHGSISGAFKNTIDWLEMLSRDEPPYLTDKVIGLIATAGGEQALQAINTMEYIVRALRGWTVPLTVPISRADDAFDDNGVPRDKALETRLHNLGRELVRASAAWGR